MKLAKPLGAWLDTDRHIRYRTFRDHRCLYHVDDDDVCWRYTPGEGIMAHVHETESDLPRDAHPVHARVENNEMWTKQSYQFIPSPEEHAQSRIRRIERHPREDMAGSDASAKAETGNRACAYRVHWHGHAYTGFTRHESCQN